MKGVKEEDVATPRCRLSDPAHPHFLSHRDNTPRAFCYRCGSDPDRDFDFENGHYYCETCNLVFHKGCEDAPQGTRHPYHPNHPIYLTFRFSETRILSLKYSMTALAYLLNDDETMFDENAVFESDNACHWCRKELGILFFRCVDCNFRLDAECMRQDPPFTITNPKSHQHPLTLFPRPLLVRCSACGLSGNEELGYACDPCNFLVHKRCFDRPLDHLPVDNQPMILRYFIKCFLCG